MSGSALLIERMTEEKRGVRLLVNTVASLLVFASIGWLLLLFFVLLGLTPILLYSGFQLVHAALTPEAVHFLLAPDDRATSLETLTLRALAAVMGMLLTVVMAKRSFNPVLRGAGDAR
jgi:hypothetical protein